MSLVCLIAETINGYQKGDLKPEAIEELAPLELEDITNRPKTDGEHQPKICKWVLVVDTNVFLEYPCFSKLQKVSTLLTLQIR